MSLHRMGYLAYPLDAIDQASMVWMYEFINRVRDVLIGNELVGLTFDPGDSFAGTATAVVGPEVERINAVAQAQADVTVAFLPRGTSSIGVPLEIERSAARGNHTLIFTDNVRSWSLAGLAEAYANVGIFGMDAEGLASAVSWLSGRPVVAAPGDREQPDPLPVLLLDDESRLPTRGYSDDAGLDLYVSEETLIRPGEFMDVPCGLAIELPEWSWGMLTGRSSTLRLKGLMVNPGVIDAGYRGPLFAGVWNTRKVDVCVQKGERLAQLIVLPNLTKDLQPVRADELSEHGRGHQGFGSTGS